MSDLKKDLVEELKDSNMIEDIFNGTDYSSRIRFECNRIMNTNYLDKYMVGWSFGKIECAYLIGHSVRSLERVMERGDIKFKKIDKNSKNSKVVFFAILEFN